MKRQNVVNLKKELMKKEASIARMRRDFDKLSRVKDDIISVVSHELRTPLSIVKEGINLTLDEVGGKVTSKQKEFLSVSKHNIDRLANLINDLLDISKIEAKKVVLRKSLTHINPFISGIAASFQKIAVDKEIELGCRLPPVELSFFVDVEKITQVLNNLISNALKFTKAGGKITIVVQEKHNNIQVSVHDTGIGISKENIDKLFNKFVQVGRTYGPGEKGTGLGLAISKGLVELHGGRVWVESKIGGGSKFHFVIPKASYEEIFREYVKNGIRESQDKEKPFSILVSKIDNFDALKKKYGLVKPYVLLEEIVDAIRKKLRRVTDLTLRDSGECAVVLSETNKQGVISVEQRVREAIAALLVTKQMDRDVQVSFGSCTYPEEATDNIEMIARARAFFEGLYFGNERRRNERRYAKLHIELVNVTVKKEKTQSINISKGGLCVFSNKKPMLGERIQIDIKLPRRSETVSVAAKVVWIKRIRKVTGYSYKIGLKYEDMNQPGLGEVMNFVSGAP